MTFSLVTVPVVIRNCVNWCGLCKVCGGGPGFDMPKHILGQPQEWLIRFWPVNAIENKKEYNDPLLNEFCLTAKEKLDPSLLLVYSKSHNGYYGA